MERPWDIIEHDDFMHTRDQSHYALGGVRDRYHDGSWTAEGAGLRGQRGHEPTIGIRGLSQEEARDRIREGWNRAHNRGLVEPNRILCGRCNKPHRDYNPSLPNHAQMPSREELSYKGPVLGARKTAHGFESSDEVTCRHCPFCGSGNVWGKSDGNIHCEFCGKDFTIQVQPEYPQMAQNMDGTPLDPETGAPIPGAGGPPGGGGMLEDAPGADEEGGPDEGSPEDEEDQGKVSGDEADDEEEDGDNPMPFQSSLRFYITHEGRVLSRDDLINYLAIRHASDKAQIASAVKAYNRK